ncbi:MAG: phenylalanine--tRNA ligase subunit beta [Alphaproteobacteria bacterium]|nr:phenylalanine--tRNA ligase subunit beta [Alphaproteobacteria bacterium]MBU1514402.1 phenylalanine--tRNA ligase subunit beta [Alphaproteobacteria bacterium]MBU2096046.1 phenylalanine--tRNA ligase subunit beta [Alphaproteobacteria bacterium]MBU2150088.1 phenylalanine--tRNA ligase subunit beta [Alphaproteobacteria bacterium]MBU2308601.1 phenylalanine--tRNA ligase subunit beta [Alphaproteobacteria bacterium]
MKFTLSWLKEHLDTTASVEQVVDAMTMAGLEVEHVEDPGKKLAAFTVAKIVEAVQHPNADKLRVCQVDTKDGRLEIVCGAPNARAGLTTIYAPIGAYVPGSGVTLEARPVRGVVSNGMLCSAKELEIAEESDGIVELSDDLAVGAGAVEAFGLEAAIDFEVTPNRPDWLGVRGIARDLAAAGLGTLKPDTTAPVPGKFPCPITIKVDGDACPVFSGRLIRGVKNGPSPAWLQQRLISVGLRPINALVDVTNLISQDRCRPLHVYDAGKLTGTVIEARLGREGEKVPALDGETYEVGPEISVIADASGPIGLGGVMGGASTGCSDATTDVFVESAWFDPIRTAQTGRTTGITSDAQYRFARGVDPESLVPGLELATQLILELCGGEPSEIQVAGQAPAPPAAIVFDRTYVKKLSGLDVSAARIDEILTKLGFTVDGDTVTPPSWRRDAHGKADLVEEVARIEGFDSLPALPLPEIARPPGGALTVRQRRMRDARRTMAARGYAEAVTWSFMRRDWAELFDGGDAKLVLTNPIAADLSTMRPSALGNLIDAAARNARKGFADAALFEVGPNFRGDQPADQWTAVTALLAPHTPKHWAAKQGGGTDGDSLFTLKADLLALLNEIGAPSLQVVQGQNAGWWHPGRSARLQLGPKVVIAEFGELHPRILKAIDAEGPMLAFELNLDAIPEPKRKGVKTKPALELSPLMPLKRDFAFLVAADTPAGDLIRPILGADKALIADARIFDVYAGQGVPEGMKSVAVEVVVQPREKTLTDGEIEGLSGRIVAAAEKAVGAKLRG